MLLFAVFIAVYYAATRTSHYQETLLPTYIRFNAKVSAVIIRGMGQEAKSIDDRVVSPGFSISLKRGCDAVDPSALFVSAVLASPVSIAAKGPGVILGTLVLMLLNLVRIVSLLFVGLHYPSAFEIMHVDVWQAIFIFLALVLWVVWIRRAVRLRSGQHAPAT